jgi:hypothetical protein
MSVYRELFHTAEMVEKQSVRIYPDACDCGVPVKSNDDTVIKWVKSIIDQYRGVVKTESYSTGSTQTITIECIDEWVTKKHITFTFTYVFVKEKFRKGLNGAIGYINVERN